MARTSCAACGSSLPKGSTYCPSCGALAGAGPALELDLDQPTASGTPAPAVVELGGRRPSGRAIGIGIAVVVGVIVAASVLGSRGDDTSSATTTAAEPPSTTAPPTTTSVPATTTTAPMRREVLGPLLDRTTGWAIAVIDDDGRVLRVELDSGMVTQLTRIRFRNADLLRSVGKALVVSHDGQVDAIGPDGEVVRIDNQVRLVPSLEAGTVILQSNTGDGGAGRWRLDVGPDGHVTPVAQPVVVATSTPYAYLAGVLADGRPLMVANPGGTYVGALDGSFRRLTGGAPMAMGPDAVITFECDDRLSCSIQRVGLDGSRSSVAPVGTFPVGTFGDLGATSPDGRYLFASGYGDTGPTAVRIDLTTGTAETGPAPYNGGFGSSTPGVWAPDSSALVVVDDRSRVQLWPVAGDSVVLGPPDALKATHAIFLPSDDTAR